MQTNTQPTPKRQCPSFLIPFLCAIAVIMVLTVLMTVLLASKEQQIREIKRKNAALLAENSTLEQQNTELSSWEGRKYDLSAFITYTEEEVTAILGEPESVENYADDPDPVYRSHSLLYQDIEIHTDYDEPRYVRGITINDEAGNYIIYGLYIGMPKSELQNNLNPHLSLNLDYEHDVEPFADNFVSYQIDDYYQFINVELADDKIVKIEYFIPV